MKQVNWGIIGLGKIALKFAESFNFTDNARIKGITSKDEKKLEYFKTKFQIEEKYCFKNYEELVDCDEIDIVYIALPNSLHYEWIDKCIEKNKKILVEKPSTLNFLEIEKIDQKFDMKSIFFAEAFMYRFHPQILKVAEIIKKKEIGNITSMKSYFGKDILSKKNIFGFKRKKKLDANNRLFSKKLGGGAILDLGCYPVSFSIFIASLITEGSFKEFKILNKKKEIGTTDVDLDSYAEIKFENNFKSQIGASFTKNLGKTTEINGKKGKIIIEDTWHGSSSKIWVINKSNKKEIKFETNENIYSYQIKSLSKNILEHKKKPEFPGMTFEESLINMKIIQEWIN